MTLIAQKDLNSGYHKDMQAALKKPFSYSKRLTSPAAHLVFVSLGLFEGASVLASNFAHPLIRFVYLPLIPFYFIIGTFGWVWTQRQGRGQTAYFVCMTALGVICAIAASFAIDGMIGLLMILMLIMQAGVLEGRRHVSFLATIISVTAIIAVSTGTSFTIDSILTFLSALSGILAFSFLGRVLVSEEKARAQLARYAEQIEELSIMRERTRIARELHDTLGHYLTTINMQAQAAQAVMTLNPPQAEEALTHIRTLAREGLQEVRKSIEAIRAEPLENRSLAEALRTMVADNQTSELVIDFVMQGTPFSNLPEVEMTLYRITQEALTNIHKHAQARYAKVTLAYNDQPKFIGICIEDTGIGTAQIESGFGLLGLQERVHLLGGTMHTKTAPGKGFTIEVKIAL